MFTSSYAVVFANSILNADGFVGVLKSFYDAAASIYKPVAMEAEGVRRPPHAGPLYGGCFTRATPRGCAPRGHTTPHSEVAYDLRYTVFYTDIRSILMILWHFKGTQNPAELNYITMGWGEGRWVASQEGAVNDMPAVDVPKWLSNGKHMTVRSARALD